MMTKSWILSGVLAGLMTANAAPLKKSMENTGARTPVLLELFTSEGCSSCPPADRLLETLDAKQPFPNADLIVLSEHVDYWNGSGWTDPNSSKQFSQRQRHYAEHFGLDGVYTPQLIVDGESESVGSNAVEAKSNVAKAVQSQKVKITLSNIVRSGSELRFHASAADLPTQDGPAKLFIALAENKVRSNVQNGENGGRVLTHVAVVKALVPAGSIPGGTAFSKDFMVRIPSGSGASDGFRLVAFLQADKSQKIIGATQAKL